MVGAEAAVAAAAWDATLSFTLQPLALASRMWMAVALAVALAVDVAAAAATAAAIEWDPSRPVNHKAAINAWEKVAFGSFGG